MIQLRDYQRADVNSTIEGWNENDRLLGVGQTGTGKTIVFSFIAYRRLAAGPVLILAHRDELIEQARDKIARAVGLRADKEKAEERATLDSRIVVGSVQTLSRHDRLNRFPANHFQTVSSTKRITRWLQATSGSLRISLLRKSWALLRHLIAATSDPSRITTKRSRSRTR